MAKPMLPFALTLTVLSHIPFGVHISKDNGVFQVETSLEETLAMEAFAAATNFMQLLGFAGNVIHGGNNMIHSMRQFPKEHRDLTNEITQAFELLLELESIVSLLPAREGQQTEACMDCGLQSNQVQKAERTTKVTILEQLARELPNYQTRLSNIKRILSKSTPLVDQPFRTFIRRFGWHFKKQVLHERLLALERGKSSFLVILNMASIFDDFVRHGESPRSQPPLLKFHGWTPLHQATMFGSPTFVSRLLQDSQIEIDATDDDGMTALHHTAQRGNAEIVQILLQHGAKPLAKDKHGRNALAIALTSCDHTPAKLIFDKVLQSSGVHITLQTYGPVNQTTLHQIANLGYVKGVDELLKLGADPHAEDNWGYTPIHLAARKGHTQIVAILLRAVFATGRKLRSSFCGHTPLQLAAKHGHDAIVDLFLSTNPADSNQRDFLGFTPLHSAAAAGQFSIVEKLLPLTDIFTPAEVHVPSPFQLAQWGGHESILNLLHIYYFGPQFDSETAFPPLEFRADALREIEFVSERFGDRANFPYQLTAVCYLAEQYGLMHLKSGRIALASAWYDIALLTHPVNSLARDPEEVVNPIKACDHCGTKPIKGPSYTCTTCTGPCYDLCSNCFEPQSHLHKHGNYFRIPKSSYPLPSFDAQLRVLEAAMKETIAGSGDETLLG